MAQRQDYEKHKEERIGRLEAASGKVVTQPAAEAERICEIRVDS